jgi:hypothetical protein
MGRPRVLRFRCFHHNHLNLVPSTLLVSRHRQRGNCCITLAPLPIQSPHSVNRYNALGGSTRLSRICGDQIIESQALTKQPAQVAGFFMRGRIGGMNDHQQPRIKWWQPERHPKADLVTLAVMNLLFAALVAMGAMHATSGWRIVFVFSYLVAAIIGLWKAARIPPVLRFSLRALLIALTALCIVLGIVACIVAK